MSSAQAATSRRDVLDGLEIEYLDLLARMKLGRIGALSYEQVSVGQDLLRTGVLKGEHFHLVANPPRAMKGFAWAAFL